MLGKDIQSLKKVIEMTKELLLALFIVVWVNSFIISHTKVPTESMLPTISPGNHLFVNRMPYYYRDPKRGEVVVFTHGDNHMIKRVIGLPGDEINIIEDQVYINGKKLDETQYILEDAKTYIFAGSKITYPYIVPENCYFVMGDNRINSSDSRVFGPIPRKDIIAKAGVRVLPFDEMGWIN